MNTFRPNMHQDVDDIVKDYEAFDRAQNAPAEVQTKPEEWSKQMVRRGVLDPNTGQYIHNSKQMHILKFQPTEQFKANYRRIFGHE